jgi:hypothetical protein
LKSDEEEVEIINQQQTSTVSQPISIFFFFSSPLNWQQSFGGEIRNKLFFLL